METQKVLCQLWIESERGWGCRPDGYSLHRIRIDLLMRDADVKEYIREYWEGMPDSVPDEYSRPSGKPYFCLVSEETYQKIRATKNGLRVYSGQPPEEI